MLALEDRVFAQENPLILTHVRPPSDLVFLPPKSRIGQAMYRRYPVRQPAIRICQHQP
jgi:hypothetical protein